MVEKLKSLKKNQSFMKYFKNTSWLFSEKIIRMMVGFFVIIFLTRYLGPSNFGILSYSHSFFAIFTAFATLGLDIIVVREIVKNPKEEFKFIGTAFYLKAIASIISLIVIFVLNTFISDDKITTLIINVIAFSLIFQSFNVIDTYFQVHVISKYVTIANTVSFLISSAIKLLLIYFECDLYCFAYALVFDSFIIALGYIYIYTLRTTFNWKFDIEIAKYFLKNAWPLVLITLSAFIYTRIDQIMIKHLVDNEAVGNYAAAIRVSDLFYFLPGLITQSVFPKLIETKKNSEFEYIKLLEFLYTIVVWIAIPIALFMAYNSINIVNLLYGTEYGQAASILTVLSFAIIFNSIGSVFEKILYSEQYEKKYLLRTLLGMIINIILNFIMINQYGALGAAIATLMTLVLIHYVYDVFDKELRRFYYMKWKCFIPIK